MSDQVNFFTAQFSIILAQPLSIKTFRGPKIVKTKARGDSSGIIMGIFNKNATLEWLNQLSPNTMAQQLGIEFTAIGDDYLEARMPVDHRTKQPLGLLHGGASLALAETLGSIAATACIDIETHFCVGLEINANHLRAVREGYVRGRTSPLHVGKKTQVWEIRIVNEATSDLVCISRITIAVLEKKK
jgi:1,4-dihydroxy-2-naphthoyl-CoA hydrolase